MEDWATCLVFEFYDRLPWTMVYNGYGDEAAAEDDEDVPCDKTGTESSPCNGGARRSVRGQTSFKTVIHTARHFVCRKSL